MKRCFDLVVASCGLVLFLPLLTIVAAAVKLDSPGPVFFRQTRVGKGEVPFRIFKFRSMFNEPDNNGHLVTTSKDRRVTRVGRFLRKWKLDELPQLINVVLGDMSLVGPRPEVPKFANLYSSRQRAVLYSVRPGITDIASIKYCYEEAILADAPDPERMYQQIILPEKYKLYERYIAERSFWLDLRLIVMTIARIFSPETYDSDPAHPK